MVVEREITSTPLLCNWPERDGVWASVLPSEAELSLSCRDGAPYCEKDYQGLFGVKCEACHQFITGKVLEVSDAQPSSEPPSRSSRLSEGSLFPSFSHVQRKESSCS